MRRLACALSWAFKPKRGQAPRTPKTLWSAQACLRLVPGFQTKAGASPSHSKNPLECASLLAPCPGLSNQSGGKPLALLKRFGVRKLACALSWALETNRGQAPRTPKNHKLIVLLEKTSGELDYKHNSTYRLIIALVFRPAGLIVFWQ